MLALDAIRRKARMALILRARRAKAAKYDGDNDGFRTGPTGEDNIPYTPAAKRKAAAAKKAAKAAEPAAGDSAPPAKTVPAKATKAAKATKTPAKRAPRKTAEQRAQEAMEQADEARIRVQEWLDSDRSGDPLAGMTTPQLKAAADALGITVEGRATAPRLKTAILRELADVELPKRRPRPTTVDAPWLPGGPRPLSDLSAQQAARAAREGLVDPKAAADHIRAQADEADRAAQRLRLGDFTGPDERTPRQRSLPHTQQDREEAAARREHEAARLRALADRIGPPAPQLPPAPARPRARPRARADRPRVRAADDQGVEAMARRAGVPRADLARAREILARPSTVPIQPVLTAVDEFVTPWAVHPGDPDYQWLRRLYDDHPNLYNVLALERQAAARRAEVEEVRSASRAASTPSRSLTEAQSRLDALMDTEPDSARDLGGGRFAAVSLQRYGDSTVIEKIYLDDSDPTAADREELGALVMAAVGAPAPAVARRGDRLLMEHVDGTTGTSMVGADQPAPPSVTDSPEGRLIGLADLIMANPDRHTGNWIVTADGSVVGIDHGMSFAEDLAEAVNDFNRALLVAEGPMVRPNPDADWSFADLPAIRARIEALRPDFERLGREDWYDQMVSRLDEIEAVVAQ